LSRVRRAATKALRTGCRGTVCVIAGFGAHAVVAIRAHVMVRVGRSKARRGSRDQQGCRCCQDMKYFHCRTFQLVALRVSPLLGCSLHRPDSVFSYSGEIGRTTLEGTSDQLILTVDIVRPLPRHGVNGLDGNNLSLNARPNNSVLASSTAMPSVPAPGSHSDHRADQICFESRMIWAMPMC